MLQGEPLQVHQRLPGQHFAHLACGEDGRRGMRGEGMGWRYGDQAQAWLLPTSSQHLSHTSGVGGGDSNLHSGCREVNCSGREGEVALAVRGQEGAEPSQQGR